MKYQLANNEDAQYVRGSTNVSIFNIDTNIKTLQTDKQDKNFVVTFTPTWEDETRKSFTATADKTFAETLAAYNAGKTVTGILLNGFASQPTPLSCCYAMSDGLQFVQPCVPYGFWACGIVWQADGTVFGLAWTGLAREDADTSYASINGSDSSNFNAAQLSASSVKINNVGTLSLNAPNIQLSNSTGNGVYTFDYQKTGTVAVTSDIPDISGKADTTTVNAALALKADKAFIVHLTQEVDGETTTYSVDKTVAEMHAAVANGQSVYVAMQEGDTIIQYATISVIQPNMAIMTMIHVNQFAEFIFIDNNGSTNVGTYEQTIASEDFVHTLTDNKEAKTTIENVNSATISQTISSNKLYIFGSTTTPVTSFTLTGLTATESTPYVNKYHGFIYCGDNMSFTRPVAIKIANDQTLPLFSSGHLFEFSILNNILTFTYTTL